MLEITKKKKQARTGILKTKSGEINTPFFMPIGTKAAVKNLFPEEIKELGGEIILSNTYHLWLRPGDKLIKEAGGLHKFMNWSGPILTDSGGFQVFSLGYRAKDKYGKSGVRLTDEGVEFSDPENGKKYFMTPEKSIEIQLNLGSDIIMALDDCAEFPVSHQRAEEVVKRTTAWAKRCLDYFEKRTKNLKKKPLIFAIVKGSNFEDLRERSVRELTTLNFNGFAIGDMVPLKELTGVLKYTLPLLPEDKPRYIMGIGKPEEIAMAVSLGADMFDCVIPTREGRHGRLFIGRPEFTNLHSNDSNKLFYETINITNEKYKNDFSPVNANCDCRLCRDYSRAYLRHLFATGEPLALRLASIHNLKFYFDLIKELRNDTER